jgi:hypothetical protein
MKTLEGYKNYKIRQDVFRGAKSSKSFSTMRSFREYCALHPSERFWQALRNWAEVDQIVAQKEGGEVDTFYFETRYVFDKTPRQPIGNLVAKLKELKKGE